MCMDNFVIKLIHCAHDPMTYQPTGPQKGPGIAHLPTCVVGLESHMVRELKPLLGQDLLRDLQCPTWADHGAGWKHEGPKQMNSWGWEWTFASEHIVGPSRKIFERWIHELRDIGKICSGCCLCASLHDTGNIFRKLHDRLPPPNVGMVCMQ